MSELHYADALIADVLKNTRTVAMPGASPNWVRPSNFVVKYLQGKGYTVHPINPGHAGKEICGAHDLWGFGVCARPHRYGGHF